VNGPIAQFGHRREFNGLAHRSSFQTGGFHPSYREVWLKSAFVAVVAKSSRFKGDPALKFSQRLHFALNSDPDHTRTFGAREAARPFQRDLKRRGLGAGASQCDDQLVQPVRCHVAEKLESEVKVLGVVPTHCAAG